MKTTKSTKGATYLARIVNLNREEEAEYRESLRRLAAYNAAYNAAGATAGASCRAATAAKVGGVR